MRLTEAHGEALRFRDEQTYQEWGSLLSVEQFLTREALLRDQPWTRKNMKTWFLVDEASRCLASCESFCLPSRGPGASGNSYSVASVFTEPSLRGKGYASQLLTLMIGELEHRDAMIQSVILFSDVGEVIYSRLGFCARPAMDWVWKPQKNKTRDLTVKWFSSKALEKLRPEKFQNIPGSFQVIPEEGQIRWRLERQRIYADYLGKTEPKYCGAQSGDALAIWAADYKESTLKCLLFISGSEENDQNLVNAMSTVAVEAGLETVTIWSTPDLSKENLLKAGAEKITRIGSLPMIRSSRAEVLPGHWEWIPNALWV